MGCKQQGMVRLFIAIKKPGNLPLLPIFRNLFMEAQELVSVIIPFLNGSGWLVEAIESVVSQTYPHWELIVLDDGSDEEHSKVAKLICSGHPGNMLYAEHAGHINRGVSISRNEACKLSHGKYLAFLDADDVWLPNKLTDQLAMFAAHPQVEVVFGAFTIWQSWQKKKYRGLHTLYRSAGRVLSAPKPEQTLVSFFSGYHSGPVGYHDKKASLRSDRDV